MQLKKIILSSAVLTKITMLFRKKNLKKKKNIKYGKKSFIGFSTICEGNNGFGKNSIITSSHMGYGSYIAQNTKISKTRIGRYCSIGPNVNCIFGKHPSDTFVSTHPVFFSLKTPVNFTYAKKQLFQEFSMTKEPEKKYTIKIGNDVWIGANVSIFDGIEIGDGAIVAANALVNKNVAPYTIVGGVPAKIIKKRFSNEDIEFLSKLKWWDKPEEWIVKYAPYFTNIKEFKKKLSNEL